MAAFFVVAYFAISVPAIGAGIATVHIGLESAATWFGFAVAIVAALVSIIGWFELRPAGVRRRRSAPAPRLELDGAADDAEADQVREGLGQREAPLVQPERLGPEAEAHLVGRLGAGSQHGHVSARDATS